MQIARTTLDDAARSGLIAPDQVAPLWAFIAERQRHVAGFRPAHILYYLGGFVAIGAMSLFMTLGWQRFGPAGLLFIALCYGALGVGLAEWLLRRGHRLPAGIAATFAVTMTPLLTYAAQHLAGLWPDDRLAFRAYHTHIDWRWLFMELATLAAAAVALWRWRLPFLVMPVAVTLWYVSMDIVPMLLGGSSWTFFSQEGLRISMAFGAAMTLFALWVDVRSRRVADGRDFAFWLYLFGVIAFWGALSGLRSDSELSRLGYGVINLAMIGVGAALSRRVFAVFGAVGVAGYLGHLSHSVFQDSLLFPVALTAIGAGIVAAGLWWQRHEEALGARLRGWLPAELRRVMEDRA